MDHINLLRNKHEDIIKSQFKNYAIESMSAKDLFQLFLDKANYKQIEKNYHNMDCTNEYTIITKDYIIYNFGFYKYIFNLDGSFKELE